MDLRTGWDLSDPLQSQQALRKIDEDKPTLLITSPPCAPFSQLNPGLNYSKWSPEAVEQHMQGGR